MTKIPNLSMILKKEQPNDLVIEYWKYFRNIVPR
jgi:hypothetical protein